MDLPQIIALSGFAVQFILAGIAYGDIRARISSIESKINGNGTYLPRTEATLMFKESDAARMELAKEIGEVRDDIDRLKEFYAEYGTNGRAGKT